MPLSISRRVSRSASSHSPARSRSQATTVAAYDAMMNSSCPAPYAAACCA